MFPAEHRENLEAYFQALNAHDMERHMALLDPEVVYHGSVSKLLSQGVPSLRGIFSGALESLGLRNFKPTRAFGDVHEVAVHVEIEAANGHQTEGIWVFGFGVDGRITRLSILWDPRPILD